jgi:hypothetical protein
MRHGYLMNRAVALVHLDRFGEALTDYYRILAIESGFSEIGRAESRWPHFMIADWERIAGSARRFRTGRSRENRDTIPGLDGIAWTARSFSNAPAMCSTNPLPPIPHRFGQAGLSS